MNIARGRMKVCFVSHTSLKGGAERSLLETIQVLRMRGVECTALLPAEGPLAEELARLGVRFRVIHYRAWIGAETGPWWRRFARTSWNLAMTIPVARWIRRQAPDLVYTNTLSICVGAWAAWLARRPHVWHIRELGHEHNRRVFDLGERRSVGMMRRLSVLCLANSNCVAERYREALAPTQIRPIYQGVRLEPADPLPRPPTGDEFLCVAIGSISPAKRQEEAIRAVARLNQRGLRARLLIVGEGDRRYERELRRIVAELDLGERVSFMGLLDSAAGVIRSADAVVNCSRHEAFGRVTVEGMLAGKPVIGARSAGTAELIEDGRNGLLYEPGDVEQLEETLRRLIEDPDIGREIGRVARAWASERFATSRFGDELLALLEPLIDPRRP